MLSFSTTGEFNTLEAVNLALVYMREPRIDDLALINTSFAAETAYANLLQQNRMIQSRGWWFNDLPMTVSPATSGINAGKIMLQTAWSRVTLHRDERFNYAEKVIGVDRSDPANPFLYNFTDGTANFTNPVKLQVLKIVPYDQAPDIFRQFVALHNASLCGQQVDENIALSPFHQRSYETAEAELASLQLQEDNVNMFSGLRRF